MGELGYLNLIKDILENGDRREDRTGTGTMSVFGRQLRFSLDSFPLLTTKKTFFKGIVHELLWFLRGSVDNKELTDLGVHIWDGNCSEEYLKTRGLENYETGRELGPIYGFQWRHSGGKYLGLEGADLSNPGIDQIKSVIESIKNDPFGRRHIVCAWNPIDIPKMAIPPCHVLCQFYVRKGKLDCQLYQRSGDVGLGVPFNIASYSLLTYLVAHCTDLLPGEFIHTFGDAHIYLNHVDQLKLQLTREPFPFPTLKINTQEKDIFKINYEDIVLENYKSHPAIKMDLSV